MSVHVPSRLLRFSGPLLGLVLLAVPTFAQEQPASPPAQPTLDDLDQRVKVLERLLELQDQAAAEKAKTAGSFTAGKEGFSWKSADGAYVLKLRGYIHSDGRFFAGDKIKEGTSILTLRRIRPIIEGTVAKSFDFRIMPDWGGGSAVLYDGYVEYRAQPWLKIRTGKFKPPIGYERLMSATEIVFLERALPTNLVPNRDVGFQVSGDFAGGKLTYAAGVFDGAPDGAMVDTDINDLKETSGRLFAWPLKSTMSPWLSNLGLGLSASVGQNKGTPSATGLGSLKTPGQQTMFSYRTNSRLTADSTVVAQGRRLRWSPQGCWYSGRIGGYGEYVESRQELQLNSRTNLEHKVHAWEATGSFALTKDEMSAKGVSPKKPFDPGKGAWGAVTLDGRYSRLVVDKGAFPTFASLTSSVSQADAWAAGLTWYMNKNVKLVADYEQTKFKDGATAAQGHDREQEKVISVRTQLVF
ncbi:MAG: porin [bacterium]